MSIVKFEEEGGEEILRKVSEPVTDFSEMKQLEDRLVNTIRGSELAIAIASPQIGVHKRVFTMNTKDNPWLTVINPEFIEATGRMKYNEGCLSFPGQYVRKKRKQFVKLKYQDVNGEFQERMFNGVDAVVVQHEIDHLDGKLFID